MANKFFGAKVNINSNIFHSDVREIRDKLIPDKIKEYGSENVKHRFVRQDIRKDAKIRNIQWTLANISEENSEIISGDVVKSFERSVESLVGTRTVKEFRDEAEKVHFFYFIKDEILLCQSKTDISYEDAFIYFKKLLVNDDVSIGDLDLKIITKTDEFEKILFSDTIRKIKLNYVVPNDPRTLNRISDILLDNKATKGKFEMANEEDGIKLYEDNGDKSNVILDLLEIVKKGYGIIEARIGGRNKSKVIKSDKFPASSRINTGDLKKISEIEKLKNKITSHQR